MADIFGFTDANVGGVFDSGKSAFSGSFGGISLIQNWQVQYSQQLQPLYEVGSNKVYWTRSHASGQVTIGRILSSGDVIGQFGGCSGKSITITAANGVCTGGGAGSKSITMKGTVLMSVGYSGQAGQAYVTEQVTGQFVSMS